MADETRKERAERIAREVLAQLKVGHVARVDELKPATWKLTVYGERIIEVEFETHPSDQNMVRDLRKKVRDAMGH